MCAGWRWCAFRVSSLGGGLGSHGFRFVFLFCGVVGGHGAGRAPSLFGAGGGRYHANPAKTRGFRQGEKTKQRKQEKRKKKRKTLEDNRVGLYTKVFGPGGRTSAKTLLKRGVLKGEKTETPKTKKKEKNNSQEPPPPGFCAGGKAVAKHMPKRGVLKMEKNARNANPPLKNFNIKSDFLT